MATAPSRHEPFLSRGTSKLGPLFMSFSLPIEWTCIGQTAACAAVCYAKKGHYLSRHVQDRLRRNLDRSRSPTFARSMAAEIRRSCSHYIRIHASGDFYDAEYVRKWTRIAATCSTTTFLTYTRSWRAPEILPALVTLAGAPNVHVWWSEDRDTGPSPPVPGIRACFLVETRDDEALVDPARHALVFRDTAHRRVTVYPGPRKRINSVIVCPYDQWYRWRPDMTTRKEPPRFTCSSCRLCFRNPVVQASGT
jgi:hypothetical protein